jgi:hypothetical protein
VNRFPFALIFVALEALGRVDVLLEWNRVGLSQDRGGCEYQKANNPEELEGWSGICLLVWKHSTLKL